MIMRPRYVVSAQVSCGLGSRHHGDWLRPVRSHQERAVRRGGHLTDSYCKAKQYSQEDSCSAHQKHYGEKYSYPSIFKNAK